MIKQIFGAEGRSRNSVRLMILAGLLLAALIVQFSCSKPTKEYMQETQQERDARMHWWREARFGMFIHWGLYAVPAGEYKGQRVKGIGE